MKNELLKNNKGFSLLEMVFTVFILTVGIVGIYGAVTRSMSQNSYISSRLIASYLAQEGIEITRNIRDGNWLDGEPWTTGLDSCNAGCEADFNETLAMSAYTGNFLYIDDTDGIYKYISAPSENDIKTKFQRKIITSPAVDSMIVKVEVIWEGESFFVQEVLYDWK
ncbi:prepilin-type N-terminal cleavage/methylation domain-containing protein [Candidatus Parcubacteria bacterium]|nr:prepilin-type N-terminal cleavage/methylation domain-containing protein [Candidatus Parcubacteria bacterium]